MISLTGKFIFSVLLALSQYVVPYTEAEKKDILKGYEEAEVELKDWQLEALNFKPLNIQELLAISSDERAIAQYIRNSCIRIYSSTQNESNIKRGIFDSLDAASIRALVSAEHVKELQERVRVSEQKIELSKALDYIERACDLKFDVESIEKIALFENPKVPLDPKLLSNETLDEVSDTVAPYSGAMREVLDYYQSVYFDLPVVTSKDDLPYLPELSIVFDSNGQIIGDYSLTEYSSEHKANIRRNRRVLTRNSSDIPELLKKALVSVEDAGFYTHLGVDLRGALRAAQTTSSGSSEQGASTITMQLVKNLLLYKDVFTESVESRRSLMRKLQEYILVRQIENTLSKDDILELYFNTIDFGRGVQGIVLAAKVYFGKELNDLNIQEMAFLAGLPKMPYGLDPSRNMERAVKRRNKVLTDMLRQKHIERTDYVELIKLPIEALESNQNKSTVGYSTHYVNAVQKQIQDWATSLGQKAYIGLEIISPIKHDYQKWAVESLQRGLLKFERSQKGRRKLTVKPDQDQLPNIKEEVDELAAINTKTALEVYPEILSKVQNKYPDGAQFVLGVILSDTKIGLKDGTQVDRHAGDSRDQLFKIKDKKKVNLKIWDVVLLEPFTSVKEDGTEIKTYRIASYTKVQGGVVVVDNATGAVIATAGNFSVGVGGRYKGSGGNKAFNDEPLTRQPPGSTIKPFVYLYAMNNGVLPGSVVSNANVSLPKIKRDNRNLCKKWSVRSSGEAASYTLNNALIKSKNRATVNAFLKASGVSENENPLYQEQKLENGLFNLTKTFEAFGLYEKQERFCYPIMLGGDGVRVADMAGAYATLARTSTSGHISPFTIDRIKRFGGQKILDKPIGKTRDSKDEALAYQNSVNMFRLKQSLLGVVEKGTARSISKWTGVVAGKTGTVEVCSNGCKNTDAWFVGFNKEVTVAVWVGYPENENLGQGNHGSVVALPIFKDFMEEYYKAYPEKEKELLLSETPKGMKSVKVEGTTGFIVGSEFIRDFTYYTGRDESFFESLTSEIYVTDGEKDNMSRYRRNNASMALFYKHLTKNRMQDIQSDFRQRYSTTTDNSAYDRYLNLYDLCKPWLYTNSSGELTWDPSFNAYSRKPSQSQGQKILDACMYVATNPEPQRVSGSSGNATNNQLKDFFINNY